MHEVVNPRSRVRLVLALTALVLIGAFLIPPVAQPLWYHNFADARGIWGIPNLFNVASNLPFVLAGIGGLLFLFSRRSREVGRTFADSRERLAYWIFFAAILLTGVGAAYYHAEPNNNRLLWDRLPLAIAFMALFAAVIGERVSLDWGRRLLPVLVALGAGSVVFWHWTETLGRGDLRPYLVVQLYPVMLLPLLLWLFPSRYTRSCDLALAIGCYVLAKGLEVLDSRIYSGTGFVSGHTLKHLVAGASCFLVLRMLTRRHSRLASRATC